MPQSGSAPSVGAAVSISKYSAQRAGRKAGLVVGGGEAPEYSLPFQDAIRWKAMGDVISDYRRWKQQAEDLRAKAKQAMESRFRDLLSEAMRIAEEYRADFGGTLKPPPAVTAFRYKAGAKRQGKSRAKATAKSVRAEPKAEQAPVKTDPKVARLRKRLETVKKKLETAKAAGAPTKSLEDKVYEIEDDLRLAIGAE